VTEIAANDTGANRRVVRRADAARQQELRVGHDEGAEDDNVRGLDHFLSARKVEVADRRGAPGRLVVVDACHVRQRAHLEVLVLAKPRIEQHLRARLRVGLADEALAVATVLALRQLHAVGVGVGTGPNSPRQRKRLPSELFCGAIEDDPGLEDLEGRLAEIRFGWRLEGMPPAGSSPAGCRLPPTPKSLSHKSW